MTIKDIARESGYAVSTVSRALNDHPDVSPLAKAKIRALVDRYGFVPNSNARQLKAQQTRSVLILVKGAFNLFFASILESLQAAFADSGYSTEVHYMDEDADEVAVAEQLQRERKPLGFLFLGGNVEVFKRRFSVITVPSVLCTTMMPEITFGNLSCVGVDDKAAGAAAFRYLYSKGHRRIGVIGGKRDLSYISELRYLGFAGAALEEGLVCSESDYEAGPYSLEHGHRAMKNLLARHPDLDAVFCMSDLIAIGAMRAAHDLGLRVPQEISVLGFDGIRLGEFTSPRLATIRQPQQEIARKSVAQLIDQIEHQALPIAATLPITLVEGESVRRA